MCRWHTVAPWLVAWLLLLGVAVAGHAATPELAAHSRFGFRASVEQVSFEALFTDFAIRPRIGADRLPTGFDVDIVMHAIDSGDADRDAEMQTAAWFDSAQYPHARFRSLAVETLPGEGRLRVRGELFIRGVTRRLEIPFVWRVTPTTLHMTGMVMLDRRDFAVGPEDVSSVAPGVEVFFDLHWVGR